MKNTCTVATAYLTLILLVSTALAAEVPQPIAVPVAGWLERAQILPEDIVLEAKLDTGSRTSSLHAVNLRQFRRDGKDWVAFDVTGDDRRSVRIERPVVRIVRIKSALGADDGRPTIKLGICIGSVYRTTEVNLVDRSSLTRPLLIGRRFLGSRLRVDVSRHHLLEPICSGKAAP